MSPTKKQYQQQHEIKERHVTLFLKKTDEETSIFCIYCRRKLLKTKYKVVTILPGKAIFSTPIEVKCSNKNCNTYYHLQTPV